MSLKPGQTRATCPRCSRPNVRISKLGVLMAHGIDRNPNSPGVSDICDAVGNTLAEERGRATRARERVQS